jgi:hypothetical protein
MFMKVRGYVKGRSYFCLERYTEGSEDRPLEEVLLQTTCYDSASYLQVVLSQGALPVILPRSNREALRQYDEHRYQERHLVECFINKIKHYRCIFSRFEKLA